MRQSLTIYEQLTREFNQGKLRAVLIGGQAVVQLRLAIMSKDGDWMIREDSETTTYILDVLSSKGAKYRFGSPLDTRWLAGGWSSHFEFQEEGLRIRTDFVTRPPRLSEREVQAVWEKQAGKEVPHVGAEELLKLKRTNREKDYAVIGELARLLQHPKDQILHSRSARDLLVLQKEHPELFAQMSRERLALREAVNGRDALEAALDAERRRFMRVNEDRLEHFQQAVGQWAQHWPSLNAKIEGKPLLEAHEIIRRNAEELLPTRVLLPDQEEENRQSEDGMSA